jgi:hypothetical protein
MRRTVGGVLLGVGSYGVMELTTKLASWLQLSLPVFVWFVIGGYFLWTVLEGVIMMIVKPKQENWRAF